MNHLERRLARLEGEAAPGDEVFVIRRVGVEPPEPFAGLSDDELDTLCGLVRAALDGSESTPEHSVPEEARARLSGAVTAFLDGPTRMAPST
jgi:hypothetical protein